MKQMKQASKGRKQFFKRGNYIHSTLLETLIILIEIRQQTCFSLLYIQPGAILTDLFSSSLQGLYHKQQEIQSLEI